MPVDKFGRMSDAKIRDTGVSLTYINNNYVRRDGGTSVSGSINLNGNTLNNMGDPLNPKDVATKEYADKISSLLNTSIIKLSQLYITLSMTLEEYKEKNNKTQEEINKKIDDSTTKVSRENFYTKTILENEKKKKKAEKKQILLW